MISSVHHPELVGTFGGEFYIRWDEHCARDHFGIITGDCMPGTIMKSGQVVGHITPVPGELELEAAIIESVRLRCDEGVTALSGGVDSALVAAIARRPCVAIGIEGSHDLNRARIAADEIGLSCEYVTITQKDVAEGISAVVPVIPSTDPVNTAIAVTMHCITSGRVRTGTGGSSRDRVRTNCSAGTSGTSLQPTWKPTWKMIFSGFRGRQNGTRPLPDFMVRISPCRTLTSGLCALPAGSRAMRR